MPPKIKPLRDRKYLDSLRDAACWVCGLRDGTVVGAHIRAGFAGIGAKPDDDMALPLCHKCHALQHDIGEPSFWANAYRIDDKAEAIECVKADARGRYVGWREGL